MQEQMHLASALGRLEVMLGTTVPIDGVLQAVIKEAPEQARALLPTDNFQLM